MSDYMNERRMRKLGLADPLPTRKEKKVIPKISAKKKAEIPADKALFEEDKKFYQDIWDSAGHTCQNCGCGLGNEPLTILFHHILPKTKYPQFRHTPENIALLCLQCHSVVETNIDHAPKMKKRLKEALKTLVN